MAVKKEKSDSERLEIRLSGSGGQGLIFAGIILAEAAGIYGGKNVAQTQSYGPEARGGASRSDVVISDEIISYPKTMKLDVLLALTQEACDQYYPALKENGVLIVDSSMVRQLPNDKAYSLPFTQIAKDVAKTPVVANVVSLGALSAITKIVKLEDLEKIVLARAPKGTEENNSTALKEGYRLADKLLKNRRAEALDSRKK
ncbi:MAG: 2-oxoacid:ferredoxin oxidoreductase subunit gamma [candidate division Zixibacteria bacterium]|nr:2-oxoacid:ferredoxin oxidoreductase subunit gamma [candidate division Zixibacteria bacterium]